MREILVGALKIAAISLVLFSSLNPALAQNQSSTQNASPHLRLAIGEAGDKSYLPRIKAVPKLPANLPPADISAIFHFLQKKASSEKLELLEFNAIKNELVRTLMRQDHMPADLVDQLAAMYKDKSFDDVWRDYCIQFLGQLYLTIKDEKSKKVALETMRDALRDPKGGIAGTALIALGRLEGPEIDRQEILNRAEALLSEKNTPDIVRTTALQVAASMGDKNVLKFAKDILDHSDNIPLKVSAIAAIGILGDKSEVPRLNALMKDSDIRLRAAASGALKKL